MPTAARHRAFRFELDATCIRYVDHSDDNPTSSYAPELRRRADHLIELAADIERALVLRLPEFAETHTVEQEGRRARLAQHMLETNLHQLHRAADELRHTALRFRRRAHDLEAALGRAA